MLVSHLLSSSEKCLPILIWFYLYIPCWASQVVLVVKNPSANAGDIRDVVSLKKLWFFQ